MKMKLVLLLSCVVCVCADILHSSIGVDSYTETDDTFMLTLDDEEAWHADFAHGRGVDTMPDFVPHPSFEEHYSIALGIHSSFKSFIPEFRNSSKDIPNALDPPSSMIYSAHIVEPGQKNTLICHVTGFYPAPVKVHWTRNGLNVTEGTSINLPLPNMDQTFSQISRLDFIPQLGDFYSCTVEHVALEEPHTRIWEVKDESQPSIGPSVFCGFGLVVGLLGVAVGTFFLVKAKGIDHR